MRKVYAVHSFDESKTASAVEKRGCQNYNSSVAAELLQLTEKSILLHGKYTACSTSYKMHSGYKYKTYEWALEYICKTVSTRHKQLEKRYTNNECRRNYSEQINKSLGGWLCL